MKMARMRHGAERELNRVAQKMAQHVGDNAFEAHRGIGQWSEDIHFVFGNDGYSEDERARAEAKAVKTAAAASGWLSSDPMTDRDGYSWAIAFMGDKKMAETLIAVAVRTWAAETERMEAAGDAIR